MKLRGLVFALALVFPFFVEASCLDNEDPLYNQSVSRGDYAGAFRLIASEVGIPREDLDAFRIVDGYSRKHDDRHGQAHPQTQQVSLDPALFLEGKEGACQGIAHEWTHLQQFRRDRHALHAFFSTRDVPPQGWEGCDREELENFTKIKAENAAYECLQDNALAAHAASMDIEAVLAQRPYASQHVLRDEDLHYLVDNLTHWSDHEDEIRLHSNESYYLPEIKHADIDTFCHGTDFARAQGANTSTWGYAWNAFCRGRS